MAKGDRIVLTQQLYAVSKESLAAMPVRVEREIQDALFKLGRETRDMARSYCPVKSGALQASIYVTGGGRGDEDDNSKTPFTKQSTIGYFRAIKAAVSKSKTTVKSRLTKQRTTFHRLGLQDKDYAEERTQRPLNGDGNVSTHQVGLSKFNVGGKTLSFKSYSPADELATYTPSITEMGFAGRSSFFVTVGAAAHYAGDVEFGHIVASHGGTIGHVEARPFMRPALAWAKSQLNDRVSQAFKRGLAK